ncbi:DUF427 domain-containing protein [Agrococcus sp. 1P02AA]|uniref:DUF427 domain-containing protein n=1 Tax=Agrococcus sp. 1P02AA TaxID=3132259 RepID=UPI0039A46841
MAHATWNDETIADSDDTAVVEGNHYFPRESVTAQLVDSATEYTCPWKGDAAYFDVVVGGETLKDGAWSYPEPKEAAAQIAGRIAFDPRVSVTG